MGRGWRGSRARRHAVEGRRQASSVDGGSVPVAVFGSSGGAVVQVEFNLALSGELGKVALCGGAADVDLVGDLARGDVAAGAQNEVLCFG
jgi:hypothetical protein